MNTKNELEHGVSPAPTEEAAPAAPAAQPHAAPAQPAPAPTPRKVRRVGTFTMGLCLVIAGIALVAGMFRPGWDMLNLFKLTPLVLVALGAELLVASAARGDTRLKYDFLSTVMCFFLLLAGFAGVVGMKVAEYASPENVQRMEALESEWNTAVGTALAKDKNVENVNAYVNYGFSWPEHTFVPETLAGLNGDAAASITLAGEYEDVQAFLAAAQPVVQAVKGCGVEMPDIYLEADGPEGALYTLDICGAFDHQRAVTDLAGQVQIQQWVEEAGCYMDADEAGRWRAENAAAAREEALAQREEELAAREEQLAEQQAAQQERESELAALEEELAAWQAELDGAAA